MGIKIDKQARNATTASEGRLQDAVFVLGKSFDIELDGGAVYWEKPVAVERYAVSLQRLTEVALNEEDSISLIRDAEAAPSDREPVVEALARALLTTPEESFVAVCETVDRIDTARAVLFRALDRLPAMAVPVQHVALAGRRLPSDDPRTGALLAKWAGAGREDLAGMVGIVRRGPNRVRR